MQNGEYVHYASSLEKLPGGRKNARAGYASLPELIYHTVVNKTDKDGFPGV